MAPCQRVFLTPLLCFTENTNGIGQKVFWSCWISRFGSVTMCERLDAIVLCHIVISWMRWNKPFYLRVQPPRVIEQFHWANEPGAIVSHQWLPRKASVLAARAFQKRIKRNRPENTLSNEPSPKTLFRHVSFGGVSPKAFARKVFSQATFLHTSSHNERKSFRSDEKQHKIF